MARAASSVSVLWSCSGDAVVDVDSVVLAVSVVIVARKLLFSNFVAQKRHARGYTPIAYWSGTGGLVEVLVRALNVPRKSVVGAIFKNIADVPSQLSSGI